jgi:tRNA A-37 threonylcarbamoyl transferase component Bud32
MDHPNNAYKTIATLNGDHNVYLVQKENDTKIYVKKELDVFNAEVYAYLFSNPIEGIPQIINYYEENNRLIVIENYISGTSLENRLHSDDLSLEEILRYMNDLCVTLEKLHSAKPAIIHRDIKPSNIIITEFGRAVLLDFNAAKLYSPSATEDTVLLGTQGYAAPEQYGFGSSSPQTDIYSLGILFKEMLTSANIQNEYYNAVISRCTQLEPGKRYQTISDLRQALLSSTQVNPSSKKSTGILRYALPGYRTLTPWKMLLATAYYLFFAWICTYMQINDTYGAKLWFERFYVYLILVVLPMSTFNYLGIHRAMPLCSNKYRIVRYIGVLILDIAVFFALMILLMIIEAICFS